VVCGNLKLKFAESSLPRNFSCSNFEKFCQERPWAISKNSSGIFPDFDVILRNLSMCTPIKYQVRRMQNRRIFFQYAQNVCKNTDKIILHVYNHWKCYMSQFVEVVVISNYQITTFLCWCISRKVDTPDLNFWYKIFACQTIGLGAFIGNTSQIVSAWNYGLLTTISRFQIHLVLIG